MCDGVAMGELRRDYSLGQQGSGRTFALELSRVGDTRGRHRLARRARRCIRNL